MGVQTIGIDAVIRPLFKYKAVEIHEVELEYENDYRKLGFKRGKAHTVKKTSKTVNMGTDSIPNNPIAYRPPVVHEVEYDYENDYRKLGFKRFCKLN